MGGVDVLVVTALQEEFDAARDVASGGTAGDPGVQTWEAHDEDPPPYHLGEYRLTGGGSLRVALARPVEVGGTATGAVVGPLAERLRPRCLAMSGVCAGNPAEVVLGDVIFASFTYRYQAGKQTTAGFHPDHRGQPAVDRRQGCHGLRRPPQERSFQALRGPRLRRGHVPPPCRPARAESMRSRADVRTASCCGIPTAQRRLDTPSGRRP